MHELSLTNSIINIINSESLKRGFTEVIEVRLSVGELSGVIPRCLEECFPIAAKGTIAEGAKLVIEEMPAQFLCNDCRWRGRVDRHSICCPDCGGESLKMISGREFYVQDLKVKD